MTPAAGGVCEGGWGGRRLAGYITLLFTDLGVRTPAAVSDELILDCAV